MSEEYYGDVVYAVWRFGGDPDRVDRDRVQDYQDDGLEVAEAITKEMRRQSRTALEMDPPDAEEGSDGV